MFRSPATLAAACRLGLIALGLVIGAVSSRTVQAQAPAAPAAQAPAAQAAPPTKRVFAGDGAMILNFIKPDKTGDFEMVLGKVKDALHKSDKPERKQQAAGWKVFKSPDAANGNVLYVFVIDPAIKEADYQISNIIIEGYSGAEANEILKKYAEAYAQGMNIVNLNVAVDLSK
jgi:hypothetical protein